MIHIKQISHIQLLPVVNINLVGIQRNDILQNKPINKYEIKVFLLKIIFPF